MIKEYIEYKRVLLGCLYYTVRYGCSYIVLRGTCTARSLRYDGGLRATQHSPL